MKFVTETAVLRDAFLSAARVCAGRSLIESTRFVRATVADGLILLESNDREYGIKLIVEGECIGDGSALMHGQQFSQAIRLLSGSSVSVEATTERVTVRGERGHFSLAASPIEEYPDFADCPVAVASVNPEQLAGAIGRCIPAADKQSGRYALGSVCLEMNGACRVIATDGKLCSVVGLPYGGSGQVFLLPLKSCEAIRQVASGIDSCAIKTNDRQTAVLFDMGDAAVYSLLVEGRYPNIDGAFSSVTTKASTTIQVDDLKSAVATARIIDDENRPGILLSLSPDLASVSREGGSECLTEIPVTADGSDKIHIRHDIFPRILECLKGDWCKVEIGSGRAIFSCDEHKVLVQGLTP